MGVEATDPDSSEKEKKRRSLEGHVAFEMPVGVVGQETAFVADEIVAGGVGGIEEKGSSPEPTSLAKKKREELREDGSEKEHGVMSDMHRAGNKSNNKDDRKEDGRGEDDDVGTNPESTSQAQPPSQFVCPITMEVMLDPVILASGHTYDRQSITAWLKTKKTDPMTGMRLRHTEMVPNHALKSAIMEWLERSGGGVRMQRGASCFPEGGLRGEDVEVEGAAEGDGQPASPSLHPVASVPSMPASVDALMMEQAHDEIIWAIKKHEDRLFTASADGTCRVWDVVSRRCVHVFDDHRRPVLCVTILSGRYLCTGGYDHRINVYDIGTYRHIATLEGHEDAVRSLIVVGDTLVSGSYDGTCRCWVLKESSAVLDGGRSCSVPAVSSVRIECTRILEGHKGPVRALTAVGGRLFSGSYDSTVRCWDIASGNCLGTLKGHLKPVRALTSLSTVTTGGIGWGRPQEKHYVASGSDDTTVRVWDTQSLRCVATLRGHTDNVRSLVSVPDKFIISGSWDKTIRVWDCKRWSEVACLRGHSEATLALAVSTRAGVVVSGSFDCTIRSWSLDSFQCRQVFDIHSDAVRVLEMDDLDAEDVDDDAGPGNDGRTFCYSGGYDGTVCALRITRGS